METLQIREVGKIIEIKKSIAKIVGLSRCMIGQLLDITQNCKGIIVGFREGEIIVFLLGKIEEARINLDVYSDMKPFTIPVGEGYLGRVVNALAEPIDGKGSIKPDVSQAAGTSNVDYPVFRKAPGVMQRVPLDEAFATGNLMIDATIPIGKGQRELIIGDRMTGKTTLGTDAILNQKDKDVVCIYCCIGHSYASVVKVIEMLKIQGALEYTIIVVAYAASSSGEQYLAPYTACTLGEYFMDRGRDVFVVYDDLTKHAWAYRQLSLLLERPPGRNAYPGDIFYVHSQLMERAGRYSPEFKGGSMTFFPIVDTIQGDVTGYVPSNLVSMTDGQIYLNTTLFNSGVRPAIDVGLSVSRIGNKVQCPAMRELSGMLRLEYVRYNELLKVTRFKSSVSSDIDQRLKEGEVMTHLFNQKNNSPYSLEHQLILLYALKRGILSALARDDINYFKRNIFEFIKRDYPKVIAGLREKKELAGGLRKIIDESLVAFFRERESGDLGATAGD